MLHFLHFLLLALRSLMRNRAQALLAVLGMAVGVGALVTSVALGRGAQDAINAQLRAAGANVIVITAGNYQVQREQGGGGIDSGSGWLLPPSYSNFSFGPGTSGTGLQGASGGF